VPEREPNYDLALLSLPIAVPRARTGLSVFVSIDGAPWTASARSDRPSTMALNESYAHAKEA
jgi:hypothetical protein